MRITSVLSSVGVFAIVIAEPIPVRDIALMKKDNCTELSSFSVAPVTAVSSSSYPVLPTYPGGYLPPKYGPPGGYGTVGISSQPRVGTASTLSPYPISNSAEGSPITATSPSNVTSSVTSTSTSTATLTIVVSAENSSTYSPTPYVPRPYAPYTIPVYSGPSSSSTGGPTIISNTTNSLPGTASSSIRTYGNSTTSVFPTSPIKYTIVPSAAGTSSGSMPISPVNATSSSISLHPYRTGYAPSPSTGASVSPVGYSNSTISARPYTTSSMVTIVTIRVTSTHNTTVTSHGTAPPYPRSSGTASVSPSTATNSTSGLTTSSSSMASRIGSYSTSSHPTGPTTRPPPYYPITLPGTGTDTSSTEGSPVTASNATSSTLLPSGTVSLPKPYPPHTYGPPSGTGVTTSSSSSLSSNSSSSPVSPVTTSNTTSSLFPTSPTSSATGGTISIPWGTAWGTGYGPPYPAIPPFTSGYPSTSPISTTSGIVTSSIAGPVATNTPYTVPSSGPRFPGGYNGPSPHGPPGYGPPPGNQGSNWWDNWFGGRRAEQ